MLKFFMEFYYKLVKLFRSISDCHNKNIRYGIKNNNRDDEFYEDKIVVNDFYPNFKNSHKYFLSLLEYLKKIDIDKLLEYEREIKLFNEKYDKLSVSKMSDMLPLVSVVGSFSCGKSTFINSLLCDNFCPAGIKPTTHSVSLFTYGKTIKILDNNKKSYSVDEYKRLLTSEKPIVENFYIQYPNKVLLKFKLGDSPGIGSISKKEKANEYDTKLAEKIIKESECVLFLLDITDGTLDGKDNLPFYSEIKKICKNVYIILTHGDLLTPNERANIKKSIMKNNEISDDRIYIYSSKIDLEQPNCKSFFKGEKEKTYFREQKKKVLELLSKIKSKKIIFSSDDHKKFITEYKEFVNKVVHMVPAYKDYLNHLSFSTAEKSIYGQQIDYYTKLLEKSL